MEKLGTGDPKKIGAYRLLARLGAGGMGYVYLARSDRGRTVAVKLVREELAAQEEFRARFRHEVRAARRVGGYWTAPVLDADTEAAVPWVATGYVAGPSLQQVVGQDHGALPERSVRILAAGLAHALGDIHAAGIVHRDLKPSNVLVTIDGPRVIDFGIARALETSAGDGLTRTGSLIGSPGFMAPEQVRGDPITPACDVFCLGSVLAYAATGAMPFGAAASGVHALMFRIAQEEPDLTGVPGGIADLVRHCLRKDPAARPSLADVLDRTGAEDTVAEGRSKDPWLPGTLVAQLGRHAVHLLEVENPEATTAATDLPSAPAPGTPTTTGLPGGPTVPEFPGGVVPGSPVSGGPVAPGLPGGPVPGGPVAPGYSGGPVPGGSAAPGLPGGAAAAGLPGGSVPGGPAAPGSPGGVVPDGPAAAGLPGASVPGGQVAPGHSGGQVPGGAGAPGYPGGQVPGGPVAPGLPGGAAAPGLPGGAAAPGLPGGAAAPGLPGGAAVPEFPGGPVGPGLPAGADSGFGGGSWGVDRAGVGGGDVVSGGGDGVPGGNSGAGAAPAGPSPSAASAGPGPLPALGPGPVSVPAYGSPPGPVGAWGPSSSAPGHTLPSGHAPASGQTPPSGHTPAPGQTPPSGHTLPSGHAPASGQIPPPGHTLPSGHAPAAGQAPPPGYTLAPGHASVPGHTPPPGVGSPEHAAVFDGGLPPEQFPTVVRPAHPAYGGPQPHPQGPYGYPQPPVAQNPYADGPGFPPAGATQSYGPGTFPPPEPQRGSGRSTALLVVVALVVALAAGGSVYALMQGGGTTHDNKGAGKVTPAPATSAPANPTPTPTPTTSAPASKTPSAGTIPDSYLGTWEASIDNANGHSTRRLTLTQGAVGDTVLRLVAEGPTDGGGTYHCVFAADLAVRPDGDGPLHIGPSTVTSGEPAASCSPGEATEITLLSDGRLRREREGGGENLTYTRR
ncbi:protein kinase [Streptomyces sp. NPDC026672]|uniref:serine/threonine-protein kinase n=1 Tax=unclassified Streptomyces TaxID=2593676 RepID=UPI0033E6B0B5